MDDLALTLHWSSFLTGQAAAIALGVTTLGFLVTVYQLLRIRRSARAARDATEATKTVLRTADLRRSADIALTAGQQIVEAGASHVELPIIRGAIADWLAAYSRIYALTRSPEVGRRRRLLRPGRPDEQSAQALADARMEAAKLEVMAARDEAGTVRKWRRYDLSKLRPLLVDFASDIELQLVSADDKVLRSYG